MKECRAGVRVPSPQLKVLLWRRSWEESSATAPPGVCHWELQLVKERGCSIAPQGPQGTASRHPWVTHPLVSSVRLYLALELPFSGVTMRIPCEVEVMLTAAWQGDYLLMGGVTMESIGLATPGAPSWGQRGSSV